MAHIFDDLIGRWAVNDDTGNGQWLSTAPLSNHFLGFGGPGAAADPSSASGKAISLNGANQYLQIAPGSMSGFDTSSNFTISVWFHVDSFSTTQVPLLALWSNSPQDRSFLLRIENDQKLKFWHSIDGSSVTSLAATSAIQTLGSWQHTFVIQDSNKIRMYLNNTLVASGPISGNLHQTTSAFLWLGRHLTGSGVNQYWNGELDDVIIWSRALTESQRNEILGLGTDFQTKHATPGLFARRHELILDTDMSATHYMKRNDLQPHFFFHMMDGDFNGIDISSYAFQVNMVHIDSGTVVVSANTSITFIDTMNGDDSKLGKGSYIWASSDTMTPGLFRLEIEATPPLGGKFTLPNRGSMFVQVTSDGINH